MAAFAALSRSSKFELEEFDHAIRRRTGWEETDISSIGADNIDQGRVIEIRVGSVARCRLGEIDLIGAAHVGDLPATPS